MFLYSLIRSYLKVFGFCFVQQKEQIFLHEYKRNVYYLAKKFSTNFIHSTWINYSGNSISKGSKDRTQAIVCPWSNKFYIVNASAPSLFEEYR